MRTPQDFERYLMDSRLVVQDLGGGTWLVHEPTQPEDRIVVRIEGDLLVMRLKVMPLPEGAGRPGLLEQLLRYNVTEMVHGAYGIADGYVVLVAAHGLLTLDSEEFEGAVEDFVLAVQNHRSALQALCA